MEPCQSGLTYLFAKEAWASKPIDGSNPSGSAMTFLDKVKQKIWRVIYHFFPTLQKTLLKWHLIWHDSGRQKFHIGWLVSGKTLEELKSHLHDEWGFGN